MSGTRKYSKLTSATAIPQSEPADERQVPNSAGGYSYAVSDWDRLMRFLILGADSPTYYASERKHVKQNFDAVLRCIASDGLRTVQTIVDVSVKGRAPKNDPAIFALAQCVLHGDEPTKHAAYVAVPRVCRIGTHLFQFVRCLTDAGKEGSSGAKRAIRRWYESFDSDGLAYQLVKYRSREDLSHSDLLRMYRPRLDPERSALVHWSLESVRRSDPKSVHFGKYTPAPHELIGAFEWLATAVHTEREAAELIRRFNLPREAVPTELLNSPLVWEALLTYMPMTAMIRNLATMTRIGLLAPFSDGTKQVVRVLGDTDRIRKALVHPIALLIALKTYAEGRGERGKNTWTPVQQIVDALDAAFYTAFDNVPATGKNFLLGVDVSGSMAMGRVAGVNLSPAEAAAAMALVQAKTEPNSYIFGFANTFRELGISPSMRLSDVVRKTRGISFGGTDCSLPISYAQTNRLNVDVFEVLTDSETWVGGVHPSKALSAYNKRMSRAAKMVVVGMVSNGFSIADPAANNMLDVVGFDTAVPSLIREFVGE